MTEEQKNEPKHCVMCLRSATDIAESDGACQMVAHKNTDRYICYECAAGAFTALKEAKDEMESVMETIMSALKEDRDNVVNRDSEEDGDDCQCPICTARRIIEDKLGGSVKIKAMEVPTGTKH